MPENQDTDIVSSRSVFERHATSIVAAILLAVVLWTGNTLLDVRDKLSRIEGRLSTSDGREALFDAELRSVQARLRELELENAKRGGETRAGK